MGLGEFLDYESRIRKAVDTALEKNLQKIPSIVDESLDKAVERSKAVLDNAQDRGNELLESAQSRVRLATDQFFDDLEKRWEKRLEQETRAQFKLLNRVLIYTLAVAILSFAYAVARAKLGW